ncbi:hypothetical protein NRB20_56780 [Nocardia sp. RB20]|uniref:Uncharacterized protein n=1 Tax=Nocardia macrotermitis TaxID=2585198 RepID=A0A7K0D9W6_9NOCA|nr:hypothetical protein [Nocardia macrotermitis]
MSEVAQHFSRFRGRHPLPRNELQESELFQVVYVLDDEAGGYLWDVLASTDFGVGDRAAEFVRGGDYAVDRGVRFGVVVQ